MTRFLKLPSAVFTVLILCGFNAANAAAETVSAGPGVLRATQKKDVPPGPTEKESKMGEKAAAELEKNPKVKVLDPAKDEKTKALSTLR